MNDKQIIEFYKDQTKQWREVALETHKLLKEVSEKLMTKETEVYDEEIKKQTERLNRLKNKCTCYNEKMACSNCKD